ncbi:hypothetical protein [Aureispira anguillae]|uniref:Lipoprotein n=1 Tax=Aureispira anguillae TaxID=2864201 RepID=A0A915YFE7_9BACT|nr:hypothetical protein [Aureispira anguillae]BDS12137.1 hypothetical protein AsAng_0028520 [Aureispira anguillae]
MKHNNFIFSLILSGLLMVGCTPLTIKTTEEKNAKDALSQKNISILDELQNDPDVLWMGELMLDYALDYDCWSPYPNIAFTRWVKEVGIKDKNSFKLLKYQINELNNSDNMDRNLLYEILANRKKMEFYKNEFLTERYLAEELEHIVNRVDTFITFDLDTREEKKMTAANQLNLDIVKLFRVKQLVYYSKKDVAFKSIALAVAPLHCIQDKSTNYEKELKVLFWLKPDVLVDALDLSSSSINWAKRTYRNLNLEKIKVIKQEKEISVIMDQMITDIHHNAESIKVALPLDLDGTSYYNEDDLENLGIFADTVFMGEGLHKEKEWIKINQSKLKGDAVKGLRLIQDWVWDQKHSTLGIRFVGFAPLVGYQTQRLDSLWSRPIFVRKMEDI